MDGSSWQSQSLMLVLRYEHERFVSLLREIDDDDTGLSKRDFRAAVTSLGSKIGLNPPREVIDAAFSAFDARSAGLLSLSDVSASLTRPLNASPVAGIPQRVANASFDNIMGGGGDDSPKGYGNRALSMSELSLAKSVFPRWEARAQQARALALRFARRRCPCCPVRRHAYAPHPGPVAPLRLG